MNLKNLSNKKEKAPLKNECEKCHKTFIKKYWRKHIVLPHDFACEFCSYSFVNQKFISDHLLSTHKEKFLDKISGHQIENGKVQCVICVKDLKDVYALQTHVKNVHDTNASYSECDMCGKQFIKEYQLKLHKKRVHEIRTTINCEICEQSFQDIVDHISKTHKNEEIFGNKIKCDICHLTFVKKSFRNHSFKEHKFLCELCPNKYTSKIHLDKHSLSQHTSDYLEKISGAKLDNGKIQCLLCEKNLKNLDTLKNHLKVMHTALKEESFKCDSCEKHFKTKNNLNAHKRFVHKIVKEKKVKCDICNKNVKNIQLHIINSHNPKVYNVPCDVCGKKFQNIEHVRNHKNRIHNFSERKMFSCNMCNVSYKNNISLKDHNETVHDVRKENVNKCSHCEKSFLSLRKLQMHTKIHKQELIACKICNKEFKNIKAHVKEIHDLVKEHHCKLCDKNFTRAWSLKTHIESVHSIRENIECLECKKVFNSKESLDRHVDAIHKGIKNFKCKHCDKSFGMRTNLQHHINSVHLKIRYKCDFCDASYYRNSKLVKHKAKSHVLIQVDLAVQSQNNHIEPETSHGNDLDGKSDITREDSINNLADDNLKYVCM